MAKLAVFGGLWHVLAVFGASFFSAPVINNFIKVVFAGGSMFHRAGCFGTKVYRFLPVNEKTLPSAIKRYRMISDFTVWRRATMPLSFKKA